MGIAVSLVTFFAAAKKVTAAPHRGNANRPTRKQDFTHARTRKQDPATTAPHKGNANRPLRKRDFTKAQQANGHAMPEPTAEHVQDRASHPAHRVHRTKLHESPQYPARANESDRDRPNPRTRRWPSSPLEHAHRRCKRPAPQHRHNRTTYARSC